jgi:hypothetical protein
LHTVRDAFAHDLVNRCDTPVLLDGLVSAPRRSAIGDKGSLKDRRGWMKLAPVGRVQFVKDRTWRITAPPA